jgi:hypothetical protein
MLLEIAHCHATFWQSMLEHVFTMILDVAIEDDGKQAISANSSSS